MRVALCVSGQLRTWRSCLVSLRENIIDVCQPDVFIRSWYPLDECTAIANELKAVSISFQSFSDEIAENLNKTTAKYNNTKHTEQIGIQKNTFMMFYNIWQCDVLRKWNEVLTGQIYDYVIRCRPDMMYSNRLTIDDFKKLDDNTILLPDTNHYGGYCDQFAIGTSSGMANFANLFNKINDYYDGGEIYHPETLVKRHIESSCFKVEQTHLEYSLIT